MKKFNFYIVISIILVTISAVMFFIHYLAFGQAENTAYYSLMSLCFIPINCLAVTIIFERLIDYKEKNERINKLNMLVGIFFSEIGSDLMHTLINADESAKNSITEFDDLKKIEDKLLIHNYSINIEKIDLINLKRILIENNDLLINLISNENLLQHEIFTDLLMSVIHLRDEILFIERNGYSEIDTYHLTTDIERVYKSLNIQWINYLKYLKNFYPFLYSNAIRVNPFIFK